MSDQKDLQLSDRRIDTWKEIGAFFGRDERTVKRWESQRGMPVHRIPGGSGGSVFAFAEELTAWLETKKEVNGAELPNPVETSDAEPPSRKRTPWMVAAIAVLVVGLVVGVQSIRVTVPKPDTKPSASAGDAAAARHEAEDLYLQGRFYWNTRTPEGLTKSVDYFTKATERDPTYALGYAGLADSYNLLREYTSMPGSEAFPLALVSAKKAIELDESLPEAHRALAFVYFNWTWDVPGAEREYRRAIELRPTDSQTHHWYATTLMELARYKEAMSEIDRARELDPSSKSIAADRGLIVYCSGQFKQAVSLLKSLEKVEPEFTSPHSYLATMYFEQKQYENYFAESRVLAKLSGSDAAIVDLNEQRFMKGGEKALLEGILSQRLDDFQNGRGNAIEVAVADANLGRKKESVEYLERALQRHEYALVGLRNITPFKPMANDPEFHDLLKRIGKNNAGGA